MVNSGICHRRIPFPVEPPQEKIGLELRVPTPERLAHGRDAAALREGYAQIR